MPKKLDVTMVQREKLFVDNGGQAHEYLEYEVDIGGEKVVFYPNKEGKDLVRFLFKQMGEELPVK